MASNFSVNVEPDFNIEALGEEMVERYQAKGFKVRLLKMKKGVKLVFDKNCGGINMILGMGQGISATCTISGKENDTLNVNFSDGDWTGKIIGCIVGWFVCFVPVITAVIGICKQLSLPGEIGDDIQSIVSE